MVGSAKMGLALSLRAESVLADEECQYLQGRLQAKRRLHHADRDILEESKTRT
jgi:hypothetical protein